MAFIDTQIRTKFGSYTPITMADASTIVEIRSGRESSVLTKIDDSLDTQKRYVAKYLERFNSGEEVYFKISDIRPNSEVAGLVRVTELGQEGRFNYQSLIFRDTSTPHLAIDAIFTMYELGFERYDKEICGPWLVPKNGEKIYRLHQTMGMAIEMCRSERHYFFVTTRESFLARKDFFKNFGFGLA